MKKDILAAIVSSLLIASLTASAQSELNPSPAPSSPPLAATETTTMEPVVVSAELSPAQAGVEQDDTPYETINMGIGASAYTLTETQIRTMASGENTSINNILARTPGVSTDTYGAIHFRNEDPFYRYYINGVLLPKGITGFGQDIDPRFIESMTTIVGAVPAYYPDGNFGIIDIRTKTGGDVKGGSLSFYGGSFQTYQPSFTYGNKIGDTEFFFTGSWYRSSLGLENTTPDDWAIHDVTSQFRGFGIVTQNLANDAKLSFIGSASYADFEIPNSPSGSRSVEEGDEEEFEVSDQFYVNPSNVDNNQNEQTYFGIVSYNQTIGDLSLQVSQVNRFSRVLFNPDVDASLYYDGVSSKVYQQVFTSGGQVDLAYQLGDSHTIRGGVMVEIARKYEHDTLIAFPVEEGDEAEGGEDVVVLDEPNEPYNTSDTKWALSTSAYLQDEWRITKQLTVNYGVRFDIVDAYVSEFQFSPRVNIVYQPVRQVALHAGYARYFAPPPLQSISQTTINDFRGTTNSPEVFQNDPVKAERSDYFDVGAVYNPVRGLEFGLDLYYKIASSQVDDGEFGEANIESPYNYGNADMYGLEFSASYVNGGFSSFFNFSVSDSWATRITSSQFQFEEDELEYINNNYVRFDQQQIFTGSAGIAYTWNNFTIHTDGIFQNGIRAGFVNQEQLDPYFVWSAGVDYVIKNVGPGDVRLRFDVLNLLDSSYVINSGTGIGEGAPKYGNRIGFYGGISYEF
jgi:outer membrane receptor for ferrienterochelin and colicins